jgi:hypothetical protein
MYPFRETGRKKERERIEGRKEIKGPGNENCIPLSNSVV